MDNPILDHKAPPLRPTVRSPQLVSDAVGRCMASPCSYADYLVGKCGREKVAADLTDVFVEHDDGYEMAKHLERLCGWHGVDAEVVETLEATRCWLRSACARAVREWVRTSGVRPAHGIGTTVRFLCAGRSWSGIISEVREHSGEYTIVSEALSTELKWIRCHTSTWEEVDMMNPA